MEQPKWIAREYAPKGYSKPKPLGEMFIIVKKPARFMSIPAAHSNAQLPNFPEPSEETEGISAISSSSGRPSSPLDLTVTSTTPNQEIDNSLQDNHVQPSQQVSCAIKRQNLKNKSGISKRSRMFARFQKFLKIFPGVRRKRRILRRKLITMSRDDLINHTEASSSKKAKKKPLRNDTNKEYSSNSSYARFVASLKEYNNEQSLQSPGSLQTNKENSSYNYELIFQNLQRFDNDECKECKDSNYCNAAFLSDTLEPFRSEANEEYSRNSNNYNSLVENQTSSPDSINQTNKENSQYSSCNNNEANIKSSKHSVTSDSLHTFIKEENNNYSQDSTYNSTLEVIGSDNEMNKAPLRDSSCIATSAHGSLHTSTNETNKEYSRDSTYIPASLNESNNESHYSNCVTISSADSIQASRNETNKEYSQDSTYIPTRLAASLNESNSQLHYSNCMSSGDSCETSTNKEYSQDSSYIPTRLVASNDQASHYSSSSAISSSDGLQPSKIETNKEYSQDLLVKKSSNELLHYSDHIAASLLDSLPTSNCETNKESSHDSNWIITSLRDACKYEDISEASNSSEESSQDLNFIVTSLSESFQASRIETNKEYSKESSYIVTSSVTNLKEFNSEANKESTLGSVQTCRSGNVPEDSKEILRVSIPSESNNEAQNETSNNEQPLPDSSENINSEANRKNENSINKYLEKLSTVFRDTIKDTKNKVNLIMAAQHLIGDHKQTLDNFVAELRSMNIDVFRLLHKFADQSRSTNNKAIKKENESFNERKFKVENETEKGNNSHEMEHGRLKNYVSSSNNVPSKSGAKKQDNLDGTNSKVSAGKPLEANNIKEHVEEDVKGAATQTSFIDSTEPAIKHSNKETRIQNGYFTNHKRMISESRAGNKDNLDGNNLKEANDNKKLVEEVVKDATTQTYFINNTIKQSNKETVTDAKQLTSKNTPTNHKQNPDIVDALSLISKGSSNSGSDGIKQEEGVCEDATASNDSSASTVDTNEYEELKRKAQTKTRTSKNPKQLKTDSSTNYIPTNRKQTLDEFILEWYPEYVASLSFAEKFSKRPKEEDDSTDETDSRHTDERTSELVKTQNKTKVRKQNRQADTKRLKKDATNYIPTNQNRVGVKHEDDTIQESSNKLDETKSKDPVDRLSQLDQYTKRFKSSRIVSESDEESGCAKKARATQEAFYNAQKRNEKPELTPKNLDLLLKGAVAQKSVQLDKQNPEKIINSTENQTKQTKSRAVLEVASTERAPLSTDVVGSIINNSNQNPAIQINRTVTVPTPSPRNHLYDRNTFLPIFRRRMLKNPSPCQTPSPQPTYSFLNETTNVTIPFRKALNDRHPVLRKQPGPRNNSVGKPGINRPPADIKFKCKEIQDREMKAQQIMTDQRNLSVNLEENKTKDLKSNCTNFKEKNEISRPQSNKTNSANSKDVESGNRELQRNYTNLNQAESGKGFGGPPKIPEKIQGPIYGPTLPPYGLTTSNRDIRLNNLEKVPDNQLMFPNIQKTFDNLQLQYLAWHNNLFVPPGNNINSYMYFNDAKRNQRLKANQNVIQNNPKIPLENNLLLPNNQKPFLATHHNYATQNKYVQERNLGVNNTHPSLSGKAPPPYNAQHDYVKNTNTRYNTGRVSAVNDASTINVLQPNNLPGNTQMDEENNNNISTVGATKDYVPSNQLTSQNNITTSQQHPIKQNTPKEKEKVATAADTVHIYSKGSDQLVPYAKKENSYVNDQVCDLSRTEHGNSERNVVYSHGIDKILKGGTSTNQDANITILQSKIDDQLLRPNDQKVLWMKSLDLKHCSEFKNIPNQIVPTARNGDTSSSSSSSDAQAESLKNSPPSITPRSLRRRALSSRCSNSRNRRPRLRLRISKRGANFKSQLL